MKWHRRLARLLSIDCRLPMSALLVHRHAVPRLNREALAAGTRLHAAHPRGLMHFRPANLLKSLSVDATA